MNIPGELTDSPFFQTGDVVGIAARFCSNNRRTGGDTLDTSLVKKLTEILDKEASIYEAILKLSREKTDIIANGKVTELEGITRVEQSMILQLGQLENEREKIVGEIAAQQGTAAEDITISKLGEILPKEQSEELKNRQQKMTGIINDLRHTNEVNSKLIKNSLDYIDFSVNVLTNAGFAGDIYGKSGNSNDSEKRNFFDVKL